MSTEREATRVVRSWLEKGVTALPDRVLDSVLDQLPATPQRRSWWPARRFAHMNKVVPIAVAAAAVMLVAILGSNMLPGQGGFGARPTPSPTPASSPLLLPATDGTPLSPGTYSLGEFPVGITFQIPPHSAPAQWSTCSSSGVEQYVCHQESPNSFPAAVGFLIVDNVVADPCRTELRDPPVGPSVDDLVAAISSLAGFEATAPEDLTINGFAGKAFTITAPGKSACDNLKTWSTDERTNGMGLGESNLVRILNVGGTRVVITGAYHPATLAPPEGLEEVQQVIGSVRIGI